MIDLNQEGLIIDEETFAFLAELELRKAVRLYYFVCLLAILPDSEGDGEVTDPRRLAEELARVVSQTIRSTDLICLPASSSSLQVLLVGAQLEYLPVVIHRITDQVSWHRFQIDGERKTLTLSVGGACFPTTAGTRQDLVTQAYTLLREARHGRPGRSRYRLPRSPNVGQA